MVDIVKEFRAFYVQRATSGLDVEFGVPLLQDSTKAGDKELRRLIIQMPLEQFRIKNYFEYNENDDTVQIAPQLWQELRYYEIMDVLESAEAQITYYYKKRATLTAKYSWCTIGTRIFEILHWRMQESYVSRGVVSFLPMITKQVFLK